MKGAELDPRFRDVAASYVLAEFDTRGGEAPECRALSVRSNARYVLCLDSRGAERWRRRDPFAVDDVARRLEQTRAEPETARSGLGLLRHLLQSEVAADRAEALELLGTHGSEALDAVPAMIAALADRTGQPSVAWTAAVALGKLGEVAAAAIPRLTEIAQDPESGASLGQRAAISLGQVDPTGSRVLPTIERLLRGADTTLKIGAALAVVAIGPEAVALLTILEHERATAGTAALRSCLDRALAAVRTETD